MAATALGLDGSGVQFSGDYSGLVVLNLSAEAAVEIYRSYMLAMGMPSP